MFFEDPSKRYPSLVQVLNTVGRRRFDDPSSLARPFVLVGLAMLGIGVISMAPIPVIIGLAAACCGKWWFGRANVQSAFDPRAKEATEIAQAMSLMLTKRRLHRDLDQGSLVLLDESSRHWLRARTVLESPLWTSSKVPEHFRQVRSQALEALDESMNDILLHYRACIPEAVPNRHALDYVDEAMEQVLGKGFKSQTFPPPAFGPVREIADKIRSLADEVERMSREVTMDPEVALEASPGRSLDETLLELRQIREAEEELRQNL